MNWHSYICPSCKKPNKIGLKWYEPLLQKVTFLCPECSAPLRSRHASQSKMHLIITFANLALLACTFLSRDYLTTHQTIAIGITTLVVSAALGLILIRKRVISLDNWSAMEKFDVGKLKDSDL